jgi:hypothetical protein
VLLPLAVGIPALHLFTLREDRRMKSVAFFQNDIFDPRALNRQTYVRSVIADEKVTLACDAIGVVITAEHEGELHEIRVPWDNVRQTINVKHVAAAAKR